MEVNPQVWNVNAIHTGFKDVFEELTQKEPEDIHEEDEKNHDLALKPQSWSADRGCALQRDANCNPCQDTAVAKIPQGTFSVSKILYRNIFYLNV